MPRRSEWLVIACLGSGLFALGWLAIEHRPDEVYASYFLFGDEGYNLLLAKEMLSGKLLHRDVAHTYGPIPAYLTAGAAAAFGNSMKTYVGASLALHVLSVLLAYGALRRSVSRGVALFVVCLGLVPCMFFPLALLGGFMWGLYQPLERCCLAALALAWQPPATRGVRGAILLGSILGVMQGVKFGGAVFAGAALLAVDLLALRMTGRLRQWCLVQASTLGAFLAWEAFWVASAFLTLPPEIARDTVWPSYHLLTYSKCAEPPLPQWRGGAYFVAQQLTPCVGVALGLAALGMVLVEARRRTGRASDLPVLLLFLFFCFGCFGYFRHEKLFYLHAWAGVAGSALWLERMGPRAVFVTCCAWLPGFSIMLAHNFLAAPDDSMARHRLPNGEVIYLPGDMARQTTQLAEELHRLADLRGQARPTAIVIRLGGGFHFFYGTEPPLRNAWFHLGMFRPYDDHQFAESLDELTAVVLIGADSDDAAARVELWGADLFSPATLAKLRRRLGAPVRIGADWRLLPLHATDGAPELPDR